MEEQHQSIHEKERGPMSLAMRSAKGSGSSSSKGKSKGKRGGGYVQQFRSYVADGVPDWTPWPDDGEDEGHFTYSFMNAEDYDYAYPANVPNPSWTESSLLG